MLSYRLGTVNYFHWGLKPVLSYSKPHTFSTSLGEEKESHTTLVTPMNNTLLTKSIIQI